MENSMALLVATTVCWLVKNKNGAFFLMVLFFAACNAPKKKDIDALPFYNTAEMDAEWIAENDARYATIHTIDTFALKNQLGHVITKDTLDGHIYVANFFFSICPSICPKMMHNLLTLQDTFAKNNQIKLVSFSVMPWVDTVGQLKKYGAANDINPKKWYLLTGNKERIYTLGRTSFFAEKGLGLKKENNEFLHTESMLLIDKKGRIRGIYNATQVVDIERITEDIYTLLKE
jgi:protein SCO1/2